MGKRRKTILLVSLISCLFWGNITVVAAEGEFLATPENRIDMVSETGDSVDMLSDPLLSACNVGIGIADNGLLMTFDTTATQSADEIGVKNIVLKEKTLVGWKNIELPQEKYCTYNSDWFSIDIVYTGAKEGTRYYIECVHYAKYGNDEITMGNYSSELTYN